MLVIFSELFRQYIKRFAFLALLLYHVLSLEEGKKIVISLTSASKFNMKTADTATYQLPYTASTEEFGKLTDKENGGIVAEFTTAKDAQTAEITFTTDEEPQYAGVYSDPVTFTLEVADA